MPFLLLYQSEVIVIEENQIRDFENLQKWFLFSNNLNDGEVEKISDLNKLTAKISLDRLKLPKKYGGLSLRRISEVYSAAKTKVLMRALQDNNKQKPCNILLFEKTEELNKKFSSKEDLIHFLYWNEETSRSINNRWKWFKQAHPIFNMVEKEFQFNPKFGDTLYDAEDRKIIFFEDQK